MHSAGGSTVERQQYVQIIISLMFLFLSFCVGSFQSTDHAEPKKRCETALKCTQKRNDNGISVGPNAAIISTSFDEDELIKRRANIQTWEVNKNLSGATDRQTEKRMKVHL